MLELLEQLIREEADKLVDKTVDDGVDLHSIPHRILRDTPREANRPSRQPVRACTAPAAVTPSTPETSAATVVAQQKTAEIRGDGAH
ncbi:unnamed protein product, partial [Laminaria digitata]